MKSHGTICKAEPCLERPYNISNYDDFVSKFTWGAHARDLFGSGSHDDINIARIAVDRHVHEGNGDKVAFRWISKNGERRDFTYLELYELTNRFANGLSRLGVKPGQVVFSLLGRVPELYIGALGVLKLGAVFSPLFSAFGPEPIKARIDKGQGVALLTSERLYERKVAKILPTLFSLEHLIFVDKSVENKAPSAVTFDQVIASGDKEARFDKTNSETLALLHFTSGTTGKPKGAMHVHGAVLAHHLTGKYALDLHEGDIYWCTADPGWVTGTSYGMIAPLSNRVTSIISEAEFDAEGWYKILESEKVNVWYTAPTAVRMLMRAGDDLPHLFDLSSLKFIASVGEPLNPEAVLWGQSALGLPIHDNWWQSETGGIMIANLASMPIKPGSMGRPLPGIKAEIMIEKDGHFRAAQNPNEEGQLALISGWPSMFRGYLGQEDRYKSCFEGDFYLSGDLAFRDEDGYFWFVGRADDVIKSAGHLIGPFEVESSLIEHPDVVEAAVIGIPDETLGEMVKAFVALKPGVEAGEEKIKEILGFARVRLGPAVAPRKIEIVDTLPKTRSGKIMRRLLKARELGLPEGDTSTLEGGES